MSDQPTPRCHALKTWALYWDAVLNGEKSFEVRRNDRDFRAGDFLALIRFDPETYLFSRGEDGLPMTLLAEVSYVLNGGRFGKSGIEPGFVVMALSNVRRGQEPCQS